MSSSVTFRPTWSNVQYRTNTPDVSSSRFLDTGKHLIFFCTHAKVCRMFLSRYTLGRRPGVAVSQRVIKGTSILRICSQKEIITKLFQGGMAQRRWDTVEWVWINIGMKEWARLQGKDKITQGRKLTRREAYRSV